MSKIIRPRRVIVDSRADAINFEYIVETLSDENGQVSSDMKQVTIHTPNIGEGTNLNKVAYKVMNKCKYIPEKWIDKVTDALKELQLRIRNQSHHFDNNSDISNHEERTSNRLEMFLDLLYSSDVDKQSALKGILTLCMETRNLEVILNDHPLISAMSRILSDQSSNSRKIIFSVVKIFLAFSEFDDFHQSLSKYRIGALVVATVDLETRRADQVERDALTERQNLHRNGLKRNDNTLFFCLQILLRISDSTSVMQKMLKKKLVQMLFKALRSSSKRLLDCVLILMIRASIYEEVIDEIGKCTDSIPLLVRLLSVDDETIPMNTLRVIFNLSFDPGNLLNLMKADIIPVLANNIQRLMKRKSHYFGILYHMSTLDEIRKSIVFDSITPMILQYILTSSREGINTELAAFLINMTVVPFFAEEMMPLIDKLIHHVLKNNDILSVKILRNLSVWTRRLQISIEIALENGDDRPISLLCKNPSRFVKHIERECPDECPMYFNNYRSFKFWDRHIEKIALKCSTTEEDDLLLELIGIINHFTINDMPPSLSWSSISQKYSLIALLRRCTVPGISHKDISMEAVILCNQICSHAEGVSLFGKSKLITSIVQLFDDCDGDTDFILQILCLCETLIPYDEQRKELLLETDVLQIIFDSLNDSDLRLVAESCLEKVENYDRDGFGNSGRFALIVKERRFLIHNNTWLTNI